MLYLLKKTVRRERNMEIYLTKTLQGVRCLRVKMTIQFLNLFQKRRNLEDFFLNVICLCIIESSTELTYVVSGYNVSFIGHYSHLSYFFAEN